MSNFTLANQYESGSEQQVISKILYAALENEKRVQEEYFGNETLVANSKARVRDYKKLVKSLSGEELPQ